VSALNLKSDCGVGRHLIRASCAGNKQRVAASWVTYPPCIPVDDSSVAQLAVAAQVADRRQTMANSFRHVAAAKFRYAKPWFHLESSDMLSVALWSLQQFIAREVCV
jgi:hypothetical protein